MSLLIKCTVAVLAAVGLLLVVFLNIQTPKSKKRRKINSAMKSIHSAAKDIASMVK